MKADTAPRKNANLETVVMLTKNVIADKAIVIAAKLLANEIRLIEPITGKDKIGIKLLTNAIDAPSRIPVADFTTSLFIAQPHRVKADSRYH